MTEEELFVHLMCEVHNIGIDVSQKNIDNTTADKLFSVAQTLGSLADKLKKETK